MAGESQRQTYLEETYQTMLNPITVSVEPSDCDDDDTLLAFQPSTSISGSTNVAPYHYKDY